jgi:hypothetical protein
MIPMNEKVPLLIVDLHDLGPEYMYSLVDAYDRPIPGDLVGRPESLAALERRIQQIFPSRRIDSGAAPPPSGNWTWLIGASGQTRAAPLAADGTSGSGVSPLGNRLPETTPAMASARTEES